MTSLLNFQDIAKIFEEIELRLIASLKRNLKKHKSEEQQEGFEWSSWQAEKLRNGDISREDYDKWRYNYPKYDETSGYVKVPSQQLSDAMVEAFKDRLKND